MDYFDSIDLNGLEETMILEVCESIPAKDVEKYIKEHSNNEENTEEHFVLPDENDIERWFCELTKETKDYTPLSNQTTGTPSPEPRNKRKLCDAFSTSNYWHYSKNVRTRDRRSVSKMCY